MNHLVTIFVRSAFKEIDTALNNVNLQSKAQEILGDNWKQNFEKKFKDNPYYNYYSPNDDILREKRSLIKLITDYRKLHGMITLQEYCCQWN